MSAMKKSRFSVKSFEAGQVWQVADSRLQIAAVGKTLVHYKRFKTAIRGVPTSLASKGDLERYLKVNKAILVQE
jgi:hypothetical protein